MLTRIVSGIVGIAITFFLIMTGGVLFTLCLAVLAALGWLEYVRAFKNKQLNISLYLGMLAVICLTLSGSIIIDNMPVSFFMPVMTIIVIVFLIKMVLYHEKFSPVQAAVTLMGIFYIGNGFYYLLQMRLGLISDYTTPQGLSLGCALLWLTLIGTWASDTFAYFSGYLLGRHKLCPQVSPKKTVEGLIGGIIGTVCAIGVAGAYFGFAVWPMFILGAMIAIIATIGDLAESIIKRYTGIKDSGNLIPGHGGVLDRFDSLLFTAPFVYYFYVFLHKYFIQ